MTLLSVKRLQVKIGGVEAVRDVSFELDRGARLGVVGESGAGKSLTALAILGLLPEGAHATGSVAFDGREILNLRERDLVQYRGEKIATVFQDPMTALNPLATVGGQVAEVLTLHKRASRRESRRRAVDLLDRVGLPDPAAKARSYPHQLSGGQRQRAMIAAAMACSPALLIADEPTTALDVTVQAEILKLMDGLVEEERAALLLITHDIPVIATMCDEVVVMYGGRVVEQASAGSILRSPFHPYTAGLLRSQPNPPGTVRAGTAKRLPVIDGVVPPLGQFPTGCGFRDRCARATAECADEPPTTLDPWLYRCWHPLPRVAEGAAK